MSTKEIEEIKQFLTSDELVKQSLIFLMQSQTPDEQAGEYTYDNNSVGFNKIDATIMTSIGKWFIKYGELSDKQLELCRKKLVKYHRQLLPYLRFITTRENKTEEITTE